MSNCVYLYYYYDYNQFINNIKKFKLEDIFLGNDYDKYKITMSEGSYISIIVYKNVNILAILCNKYREIKFLNVNNKLKRVDLLDKSLFNKLLNKDFSKNLCKLIIDIDILGDDEEIVEFNGYKLAQGSLLDDFEVRTINSSTKLKLYSLQPYGYKYLINFKSYNKIEFSKKYTNSEVEEILFNLINLIK